MHLSGQPVKPGQQLLGDRGRTHTCRRIIRKVWAAQDVKQSRGTVTEVAGQQLKTYRIDAPTVVVSSSESPTQDKKTLSLPALFLPRGFPESVSEDYLDYQLWAFPSHVLGWLSISLVTSSLLKAVGLGGSATGAAAAGAAIKWITKDGAGSIGRLVVGGRLRGVFDEDPKRWRMIAEGFATTGLALQIATELVPGQFVLLAGLGNLTKAVGKGMSKPCFRIIQTHFARQNNVGSVAATEEVWEVAAQLLGLALSIGVLKGIEATHVPQNVLWIWALAQAGHVTLRFKSLSSLQLTVVNQKRACLLIRAHLKGRPLPGRQECNAAEPLLQNPATFQPAVRLGCSVQEAFQGLPSHALAEHLELYEQEQYVLVWQQGSGRLVLRKGSQPQDEIRALWQAGWLWTQRVDSATPDQLRRSLTALRQSFANFAQQAEASGWDINSACICSGEPRLLADGS
ncbi:hypothetical protein WJX74_004798 [Apatococcus lobatus]|uniref:Uncharacterized protein n=1 Tax=Apatococcus lobatus TaxID=904363 RepID=A0AAW1RNI5_9CHLO